MTADTFLSMLLAREWDYRSRAAIARLTKKCGIPPQRLILSRLTMPRTGDWTAIRWNVSPPLILCAKGTEPFITGSSRNEEKLFGLCPWTRSMQKGFRTFCQCSETARCAESRQSKGTLEAELKKIERCQLLTTLTTCLLLARLTPKRVILPEIIEIGMNGNLSSSHRSIHPPTGMTW